MSAHVKTVPERIEELVATWPPLSEEQIEGAARILASVQPASTATEAGAA